MDELTSEQKDLIIALLNAHIEYLNGVTTLFKFVTDEVKKAVQYEVTLTQSTLSSF